MFIYLADENRTSFPVGEWSLVEFNQYCISMEINIRVKTPIMIFFGNFLVLFFAFVLIVT